MKSIVITGASKGIGRAIALRFAAEGYAIAACARSGSDMQELENAVRAVYDSSDHILAICDMSKKLQVRAFAERILTQWSTIDILVNNAGVFIPGSLLEEEEGILEKMLNTNLYSAYDLTRLLVPRMIQSGRGHIFNMCSIASIQAYATGGSYSITKFAMLGLSKALREELKPHNIKVTALLPGATLTDSWAGTVLPDSRFMKVEDIAKVVYDIYSLSDNTVIEEVILRPVLGDI